MNTYFYGVDKQYKPFHSLASMEEEYIDTSLPFPADSPKQMVGQQQIQDLLFGDKLSWQAIIYDLINTEQLDPWNIDLALLAQKFLERVRELEEANFFVSSKVLLAAALLLRMKSEILLHEDLQSLDDVLFGKKEERKYIQERIELDEDIPQLIVRTPLPRYKKVTLEELMKALGNAIKTENRRIRKVVLAKQQEFEMAVSLPKQRINLQDRIREVYAKLKVIFAEREHKLAFSELAGSTIEERVLTFIPLLHLDNQQKVWLEQEGHFAEIWILLKHIYEKQNASALETMRKEVESEMEKLHASLTDEEKARVSALEEQFQDPLSEKEDESRSN